MRNPNYGFILCLFLSLGLIHPSAQAGVPSFEWFSAPFGGIQVNGVSGDGSVVVGTGKLLQAPSPPNFDQAYTWRPGIGFAVYGVSTTWTHGQAVSADGAWMVGGAETGGPNPAVRWNIAGGGGSNVVGCIAQNGTAYGASGNGTVVVGQCEATNEAFRWVQGSGTTPLGDLPGGVFLSQATGVSGDGSIVVGVGDGEITSDTGQAFRWTSGTGMAGLGDLAGGAFNSRARAISNNGQVIVGRGASASGMEAFRWESGVMTGLGDLPAGLFHSEALAVSADGSIVVGNSGPDAFIWDAIHGMRDLQEVLENEIGLDLDGVNLLTATGISADGGVIVGMASGPNGGVGYRVVIPEPTTLSLLVLSAATLRRARSIRFGVA
jgi:probable HAF family extracellular repeat protein